MLLRIVAVLLAICPFLASQTAPHVGQRAPDFTLIDSTGSPIKLSELKGKVVLLDFWATWCGGCKVEIPWYMEFETKYAKKGLATIGVSLDDDGWKSVKPFPPRKQDQLSDCDWHARHGKRIWRTSFSSHDPAH